MLQGTAEEQMLHHAAHPSPDASATPQSGVSLNTGAEIEVEAPTILHPRPHASLEVSPGPRCVRVSIAAQSKLNPDESTSVQAQAGSSTAVAGRPDADHASAELQHEIAVSDEAWGQETGSILHLAADSQHEAGASSVTAGRERVPSLESPAGSQQEAGASSVTAGRERVPSLNPPAGSQQEAGVASAAAGRERVRSLNSPAGSQQEAGVSSAAAGRERSEAARRGVRNRLLLSLHRVAVTELAEYQDLPLGTGLYLEFVAHHIQMCFPRLSPVPCPFKPGCLMSHDWLHTPDCKVLNEMKTPFCPMCYARIVSWQHGSCCADSHSKVCDAVMCKFLCKHAGGHAGTDTSAGDAKIGFLDDVPDMH